MTDVPQASQPLLRVEHLCQYFKLGRFSWNKAVDDVSFDIYPGEIFGLVGESGCGKTTTGRAIIGLYKPTSGRIYFRGQCIAGKNQKRDKQLTTQIQMIFQDPVASLDPRMTVKDIIAEGLIIQGVRDKAYIEKRVYEMLETVGLVREHAGRYPHEFSGGQRQRIGVARSLMMQPSLIIADEPISALDVSIRAQIINLLNDLRRKLGLSVLFIAHDLSVVKYISDRIGVMYNGQLVELASSEALFRQPLHPYTKALLSAIPQPDPAYEKTRQRTLYNPVTAHDYRTDLPAFREVCPGHFVRCNGEEEAWYRAQLAEGEA